MSVAQLLIDTVQHAPKLQPFSPGGGPSKKAKSSTLHLLQTLAPNLEESITFIKTIIAACNEKEYFKGEKFRAQLADEATKAKLLGFLVDATAVKNDSKARASRILINNLNRGNISDLLRIFDLEISESQKTAISDSFEAYASKILAQTDPSKYSEEVKNFVAYQSHQQLLSRVGQPKDEAIVYLVKYQAEDFFGLFKLSAALDLPVKLPENSENLIRLTLTVLLTLGDVEQFKYFMRRIYESTEKDKEEVVTNFMRELDLLIDPFFENSVTTAEDRKSLRFYALTWPIRYLPLNYNARNFGSGNSNSPKKSNSNQNAKYHRERNLELPFDLRKIEALQFLESDKGVTNCLKNFSKYFSDLNFDDLTLANTFEVRVSAYLRYVIAEQARGKISPGALLSNIQLIFGTIQEKYADFYPNMVPVVFEWLKITRKQRKKADTSLDYLFRMTFEYFEENFEGFRGNLKNQIKQKYLKFNGYKKKESKESTTSEQTSSENQSSIDDVRASNFNNRNNSVYLKIAPDTSVTLVSSYSSTAITDDLKTSQILSIDTEFVQDVFRPKGQLALIQISSAKSIALLDVKGLSHENLSSCFQDLFKTSGKQLLAYSVDADREMIKNYYKVANLKWVDLKDYESNYFSNFMVNYRFNLAKLGLKVKDCYGRTLDEKGQQELLEEYAKNTPPAHPEFTFAPENHPEFTKQLKLYHETSNRGLSRLCEVMLGQKLDKREQISNWLARPLRQEQLEYAALDAFCLHKLRDEFIRLGETIPLVTKIPGEG